MDPSLAPGPAHSDIGGSAVSRLIHCPASFRLARQAPVWSGGRASTSVYAATGTVAHALAEDAVTQGYDPASQLGETVTVGGHDVTVTAEMVEGVRVHVAECARRAAGATVTALEDRVCLDAYWLPGAPPVSAFGTADFWAYHAQLRHLDLIDYKNGAGVFVDVTDNPQLLYYAAGVLLELQKADLPAPLTIDLTVTQPNFRGKDKVRTHSTTTLDVLMWVDDVLLPTVAEANAPNARIATGPHCRFCAARLNCPALTAIRQDLARRDFGPSTAAPVELSPRELADVLREWDTVQVHIEALRTHAADLIAAGTAVPGFALVPTRPTRSWSVAPSVLLDHFRTMPALLAPPALRSPAQVERLVTPDEWRELVPYVHSISSGLKLAPDVDDPAGEKSGRGTARDDFA